jgi:hypothetical protein
MIDLDPFCLLEFRTAPFSPLWVPLWLKLWQESSVEPKYNGCQESTVDPQSTPNPPNPPIHTRECGVRGGANFGNRRNCGFSDGGIMY